METRLPRLAALLLLAGSLGCGPSGTPSTPNAAPAPAPTPVPSPTGAKAFTCPLPSMPDLHEERPKLTPNLADYVENAIQRVVREHPELFDMRDSMGEGSYKVLDRAKYHEYVIEAVHDQNVCGVVQKEEIAVKVSNAYNEQYNIWTSAGYIRHGSRAYVTTCLPTQF
jgi:hypothetical protein